MTQKGTSDVERTERGLRPTLRRGAAIAALMMLVPGGANAAADDPGDQKAKIDRQIIATAGGLDAVSRQLIAASDALRRTDGLLAKARTDLGTKQKALTGAENHLKGVNSQLKIAQSEERRARGDLTTINTNQVRTKRLVGGVARQSYMTGGLGSFDLTLQILMSRKNPSETMSLADIVMRQQNGVLTSLAGEKASKTAAINRLGAASRRVARLKVQAGTAVTAATTARNNARSAKARLESLRRTQITQRDSLERQRKADLKLLAWQKGESSRLGRVLASRAAARAKAARQARMAVPPPAAAPRAPSRSSGFLEPPASPSSIVSEFGMRHNPVLKVWMLHAGVDWALACGTPVYASAAGEVVTATYNSVAGNYVVVDHGFVRGVNLATMYEHLSAFAVRGGTVKKGQLVGYVGTTGRSTGCHLHYTTLNDGQAVDPRSWIG